MLGRGYMMRGHDSAFIALRPPAWVAPGDFHAGKSPVPFGPAAALGSLASVALSSATVGVVYLARPLFVKDRPLLLAF
jgi:hypothetical protein